MFVLKVLDEYYGSRYYNRTTRRWADSDKILQDHIFFSVYDLVIHAQDPSVFKDAKIVNVEKIEEYRECSS